MYTLYCFYIQILKGHAVKYENTLIDNTIYFFVNINKKVMYGFLKAKYGILLSVCCTPKGLGRLILCLKLYL